MYSRDVCCFERLGVAPTASTQVIKTAFRRLVLKVHPDKVPVDQKEHAAQAFREIHAAYKEATDRASRRDGNVNDSDGDPTNPGAATYTEIRTTFFGVCDQLERKNQRSWDSAIRQTEAAWDNSNDEQCWKFVAESISGSKIQKLANFFVSSNPPLCRFLHLRYESSNIRVKAQKEVEERKRVERVDRDWPELADELKQWAFDSGWHALVYDDIARKVEDPAAAQAIRRWRDSRLEYLERQEKVGMMVAAQEIVLVFPDKRKIAKILGPYKSFAWKDIYDLLPDEIRNDVGAAFSENSQASCTPNTPAPPNTTAPAPPKWFYKLVLLQFLLYLIPLIKALLHAYVITFGSD